MIDNFIYFCGEHLDVISACSTLFICILMLYAAFNNNIKLFIIMLILYFVFFPLFLIFIDSNYERIKEKKNPCEYPIDTKYHYTYNDLNNNINTFIGESGSCERNYSNNSLICHFDNTYVQVVSYSYEEEEIYAKECDK